MTRLRLRFVVILATAKQRPEHSWTNGDPAPFVVTPAGSLGMPCLYV